MNRIDQSGEPRAEDKREDGRVVTLPRALALPAASIRRVPGWLIWALPLGAFIAVASLALHALTSRGPTVTITFPTAEGIQAHKTPIKYKSVDIGVIESVDLLPDRSGVSLTARLERSAAPMLVSDTRFWVVRPRVSPSGISGIGTLFEGAYLGFDPGVARTSARSYVGLDSPPSITNGRPGRRFVIRATEVGSLDVGAPIYLRRFKVGEIVSLTLDARAANVQLEVFIDAPHDAHVTTNTRFWNASGVDLSVTGRGIKLDTQSLASLLVGGLAFETPVTGSASPIAPNGTEFQLHTTRDAALRDADLKAETFVLAFDGPVRSLSPGASVDLLGVDVGEVAGTDVRFDPRTGVPRTMVTITLRPGRLRTSAPGETGFTLGQEAEDPKNLLDRLVARGLRAQLRTENFLTGERHVAFDFVPGPRPAPIDWQKQPVELPTTAVARGGAEELPAAITRLVNKIEKLPLGDLAAESTATIREMRRTLDGTTRLVERVERQIAPRLDALLGQAEKTLGSVESGLGGESVGKDLRVALRDLGAAGQALRALAEYLERHPESLIRGK